MEAVNALMWVTLSCMLRLSPLAGTAAFVASPSAEVIGWFIAFLLLPTLLLGVIVKMKFTSLAWYFLWGWVLYLMPLTGDGFLCPGSRLRDLAQEAFRVLEAGLAELPGRVHALRCADL